MTAVDLGTLHDDAVAAITALAEADPGLTLADAACPVADAVLKVLLDPETFIAALATAIAGELEDTPGDRFEAVFRGPDGTLHDLSAGPVNPDPDKAAQRRKTRNLALIALSQEHRAEFEHLRDGFDAELGAPVPAARRPA